MIVYSRYAGCDFTLIVKTAITHKVPTSALSAAHRGLIDDDISWGSCFQGALTRVTNLNLQHLTFSAGRK